MAENRTLPPISRGPFLDPWPASHASLPSIGRRRATGIPGVAESLAIPAGNAVIVPPNSSSVFSLQRYAYANGTKVFPVSNGASTDIILKPPAFRGFLWFRNSSGVLSGTANIYIEFGGVASLSSAIRLALNEQAMFDAVVLQDDVTAYADGANAQLSVLFANMTLP